MPSEFPLPCETPLVVRLQDYFLLQARRHADQPFMSYRQENGDYKTWTWQEIGSGALVLAQRLKELGAQPGHAVVCRIRNHPNWLMAELAILFNEMIIVPSFNSYREAEFRYIKDITAAKFVLFDDHLTEAPIKALDWVIINIREALQNDQVLSDLPNIANSTLSSSNTACICFTSGTSGQPRGVILSHRALVRNAWSARQAIEQTPLIHEKRHRFFSFLPLSHSFEHIAGLWFPITLGAEIYYPQAPDTLIKDMGSASPTLVTAVPRLFETMRGLMLKRLEETSRFRFALLKRALADAAHFYYGWKNLPFLSRLYRKIEFAVLRRLLNRTAKQRFGKRIQAFFSGGAALHPKIEQLLLALNIQILQGYGLTEAAPVVSVNLPGHTRFGSVGQALPGAKVKLSEDGELMVAGAQLMDGYYKDQAATEAALRDGWLYTGDIAKIDDGFITIIDRRRDIIVNSAGQNLAPQPIEMNLELEPEIQQAFVEGNDRPFLVAILVADEAYRGPSAQQHLQRAVTAANNRVGRNQRIRFFHIAETPFSEDNEQITPTLKLRRHVIRAHYQTIIAGFYKQQ